MIAISHVLINTHTHTHANTHTYTHTHTHAHAHTHVQDLGLHIADSIVRHVHVIAVHIISVHVIADRGARCSSDMGWL